MSLDDALEFLGPVLLGLLVLFVVGMIPYFITYAVVDSRTERICLEHGWRGASVTWNLQRYCVKRIEQTDSIIPVEKL